MSPELIISIISLASTFVVGIFTAVVTFKIGRLEHLEKLKTYEKNITNFELQFKDEQWLYGIMESGEFDHYNMPSKKRIYKWWIEYTKDHVPVLLIPQVDYNKLSSGLHWSGSDGKGMAFRVPIGGESTEMVMPDDVINPEDLF